jgi:hypothetical protein
VPSELAADLRALSTQVASALSERRQQAAALRGQLARCQGAQAQLQQQLVASECEARELRESLSGADAAKQAAVRAAVTAALAQVEARYGRKLVKAEAKALLVVSGTQGRHAPDRPCCAPCCSQRPDPCSPTVLGARCCVW